MTRGPHSYAKAVDQFGRIMDAAAGRNAGSVRGLAQLAGLPATTANDIVRRLELSGLLAQTHEGGLDRGRGALAIGLAALGFGAQAWTTEPVLEQVRFQAGTTAFAAVWDGGQLGVVAAVGPQATRLRSGRVVPKVFDGTVDFTIDGLTTRTIEIAWSGQRRLLVGVVDPGKWDRSDGIVQALEAARTALATTAAPAPG